MKIPAKRFDTTFPFPVYEKDAAGFDFICTKSVTFASKEIKTIPSNLAMAIPLGYVLLIAPRSSTSIRFGLTMPNSIGVIDPFYQGDSNEIQLLFYNFTDSKVVIKKGEKIAQGILIRYETVEFEEHSHLRKTSRKVWGSRYKQKTKT